MLVFPLGTSPSLFVCLSALLMAFSVPFRDCTLMTFFHRWSVIRLGGAIVFAGLLAWAGTLEKYGLGVAWLCIAACRPYTPMGPTENKSWSHDIVEIVLLAVYTSMTMLVSYVASWHTLAEVHRLIGFWVLFSPLIFGMFTHYTFKVVQWHNYQLNISNFQTVFSENCSSHLWLVKTVAIWKFLVPLSAPQRSVAPLSMLYFALVELCVSQIGWLQHEVNISQPSLLTLWECITLACVTQRVYPVDGTVFIERLVAVSVYHVLVAWRAFQLETPHNVSKLPQPTIDVTIGKISLYAMIAGFMTAFELNANHSV